MTVHLCDRCKQQMPSLPESTSATWQEGDKIWRVTVLVPRDKDLCLGCRQLIVSKGELQRPLTVEDVEKRPLPVIAEGV